MTHQPIKVDLLGSGMIATFSSGYFPGMPLIADKAIGVAISDPLVDRARAVAASFNIPQVCASLDEMLEKSDAELIVIPTPIPLHARTGAPTQEQEGPRRHSRAGQARATIRSG